MTSFTPGRTAAARPLSRKDQWLILVAVFLGWMFAGVEMSLMVAATRPAIQEFFADQGQAAGPVSMEVAADRWFSWFLVAFLLGAAAGGALFGWLGDRAGRARAMGWSILCYSLITGLSYFVATPAQLLVLRFVACLGVGGMWPNGVALAAEAWPSVSRPMLAGLIGCSANLGFLILGWIMLYHPVTRETWRWVLLFGGLPVVLGLWTLLLLRESPVWLAERSRPATGIPSTPVIEVFRQPYRASTMLGIALGTVPLLGGWASGQRLVPWAGQVGDADNLPDLKAATQIVQSVGAVIGSLLGGWFASSYGPRRSYFLISLVSLALSLSVFGLTRPGEPGFFILAFALGVAAVSFFGWLPYYLPGLFPTRVRATGTGVAYNFGRILSAGVVFLTAALSAVFHGDIARMGLATSLIYAAGMALAWGVPEPARTERKRISAGFK